jgi:50S ribosomal protein L16 3-hydroxylase
MNDAGPTPSTGPAQSRVLTQLGRLPVREFLARYWQRRPLLIRQALPDFEPPIGRRALFELSARDEVESRLIVRTDGRWQLRHGPFTRRTIPPLERPNWTLLVQGVDQHLTQAARMVARFRFIPDARLDDLMVSYASQGGGVGPHQDGYDVFLLQALGKRRWRIERRPDPACVPGLPIRQLAHFSPDAEWVLEPGDLLYLPPGVAHDGVALGDCMTCSIGFRTPSWTDLAVIWSELQSERSPPRRAPFRDPGLTPSAHPARLPERMIEEACRQLLVWRPSRGDVATALLRQLSEPKPRVTFERPARAMAPTRFASAIRLQGLQADRRTRMLYSSKTLAINGILVPLSDRTQRALMRSFADRRLLVVQPGRALPEAILEQLYEWYLAGWVHPPSAGYA